MIKFKTETPENLKRATKTFFDGGLGVFGNYISTKNALVYRTASVVDGLGQNNQLFNSTDAVAI